MQADVIITGGSGFIGEHLCRRLGNDGAQQGRLLNLDLVEPVAGLTRYSNTDIRVPAALARVADQCRGRTLLHLAAKAEVVMPFASIAGLFETNVEGTLNVLSGLAPRHVVFASSSSVYGDTDPAGASTDWRALNPVGTYALSKMAGEMALADWARETGGTAVSLRFGNVTGSGCRGLIPYLVEHAIRHPDGKQPARIRGRGRLLRDYVPVATVVNAIINASELALAPGAVAAFNVGSGRGMSNGEVAAEVAAILAKVGLTITIVDEDPIAPGETAVTVLDMSRSERELKLPSPSRREVLQAIETATLDYFQRLRARTA